MAVSVWSVSLLHGAVRLVCDVILTSFILCDYNDCLMTALESVYLC